jgi:RNA polymerase sigma-70 factor, ECF subfamily
MHEPSTLDPLRADVPPGGQPPPPGSRRPPGSGRPARQSDAELIAASAGEPESFAAIFDRHAGELHRFAARRLGDAIAEDVVGETFLVAFRRRAAYDPAYPDARPWLYGIAANVIGRHRQAEVRCYRALARTGVDPVLESPADAVIARVTAAGERRQLAAALARLPAADRDTLLLVAWGELSYEQAARALQIPVGTVRSRLNRARRKLRKALGSVSTGDLAEETGHG